MASISPRPTYNLSTPADDWRVAADLPVSPLKNFAWQMEEGFLSSPGAGTAFRDLTTPAGNTLPPPPTGVPLYDSIVGLPDSLRRAGEQLFGVTPEPSLTPEQFKAHPKYRTAIPYEVGMTESRLTAIADTLDIRENRAFYADKSPISTFVGQFIGQAFDPINYLPAFGPGARAAAAARFGIFGHIGINASESAINTAAFGMLTASERGKYGYDVSWQAQLNDIGMSALIGAVITPVLHGLGKGIEVAEGYRQRLAQRIQSGVETVPNAVAARSVLNNAVVSYVADGEVKLTPGDAKGMTRLNEKVTAQRDASLSLARETQGVEGNKAGKVVITPSGSRVEVKPEVVELADLLKAEGALQVRDRSRAASAAQIEDIAINLDPARLMPSIEADRGAPIVGADNIVDSGNGRVAAIRRAYEAYPEQAAAYRKAIEDQGFSTEGMNQPVIVSRRLTNLSPEARAQFNAESNMPATARMSPSELAAMDARAMTDSTLAELADGPINGAQNRPFVQRFLAAIPENERGSMIDKDGALSADGVRRIERALIAEAFGDVDPTVIRRFAEATDDNSLAIVGAMSDVAGRWALMRRAIKSGEISPEFDVTPELTTALRKLSGWREAAAKEGRPVSIVIKEGMGQLDMLDGEISLETKQLVRTFYKTDEFKQSAGREAIRTRLEFMAKSIEHLGQPKLFGDAVAASKLGIIENANNDIEASLFAPERDRAGANSVGPGRGQRATGADRGNGAQGAQVGQGSIADRMTERLVAVGRAPDEAAANGALVDAFYTSMAERLGISTAELEARHPLPEVRAGEVMDEAALGQSAAPGNPAFDRWFGDSKATGPGGKPRVLYHGAKVDFESFDPTISELGTHLGTAAQANSISAGNGKDPVRPGARTIPVFVKADKPLRLEDTGGFENKEVARQLLEKGIISPDEAKRFAKQTPENMRSLQEAIEAYGYDSVIYLNRREGVTTRKADEGDFEERATDEAFREKYPKAQDSFIVFHAEQVKSQFNRGTFDPADPRILFQPASPNDAGNGGLDGGVGRSGAGTDMPATGDNARRGQIAFDDTGSVITLFKSADASTASHEFGHHFLTMFKSLAEADGAPLAIRQDFEEIKGWWASNADQIAAESPAEGVTGADVAAVLRDGTSGDRVKDLAINVALQEQWARGFESYLYDGTAPTSALARVFEQFKNWLREVYRSALDLKVNVSPELKGVFDRMLGGEAKPERVEPPQQPALDFTSPAPEPPVDGLDEAAARVGHQDTPQAMREMFGLKDDGSFDEQADIDQYREMGILDEQDEAMLKLADDAVKAADAYQETLRVAASCVAGGV